jgi:hypothetical protein
MRALLCAFFQTSSNEATNIFKAANKNSLGKAGKKLKNKSFVHL